MSYIFATVVLSAQQKLAWASRNLVLVSGNFMKPNKFVSLNMQEGRASRRRGRASRSPRVEAGRRGQAAFSAVIFFVVLSLIVIGTFVAIGITQIQAANELILGSRSFATSESGSEDALYRMSQVTFAKPALGTPYTVALNNGVVGITLTDSDGDLSTLSYTIQAQGQEFGRYRNTKVNFDIASGSGLVHVDNPVQIGYLGLQLGNNSVVNSSAGPGLGSIFSDSDIVVDSGSPIVDGTAVIAKGIGSSPWISHNASITDSDVATCNGGGGTVCSFNIGKDASNLDVAQSFVPNITADMIQLDVYIKRVGAINVSLPVFIYPNRRVDSATGNACTAASSSCRDFPATSGYVQSGVIAISDFYDSGGNFEWVPVAMNYASSKPLILNEKYWVVFDSPCTGSGCLSVTAGWQVAGLDGGYDADADYYSVPDTLQYKAQITGPQPLFVQFANFNTQLPNVVAFSDRDIALKIYLGKTQTKIDGVAGNLNISVDAKAQYLTGIDVGNDAYYNGVGIGGSQAVTAAGVTCLNTASGHCKWMNSTDTSNINQPPASKIIGPFNFAKYRELRKKVSSLGTTTPGNISLTSGTTLFPGPTYYAGVIDGDLNVKNDAILEITGLATNSVGQDVVTGKCQYNEMNGALGKPCYVLRITGDLTIENNSIIRIHCPAPCSDPSSIPSAHILVDGTISVVNNAQIYGATTTNGSSGMFVTSYAKNVEPPYAIELGNNSSGSVYFAFRGGIGVKNNMQGKALAAARIVLENNATVTFDSGLINPYSEDGGTQPLAQLTITSFQEVP
mgnify:FL=1